MLRFDQVAQLRVPLPSGRRLGSGYLLAERLVLTAGHVVGGATPGSPIDVLFPAADAEAKGSVLWSGSPSGLDAALVGLSAAPRGPARLRLSGVRWGRLTGQQPGVTATGVGFPRALKDADGERVPDQVDGAINPGTAFGQRYDVNLLGSHPLAGAEDPSPWAGLSGAALFSGDLLIGVAVIDTPNFQSGRLTAVPAWCLLADSGFLAALVRHGCAQQWESVELAELFEPSRGRLDSPASLLRADTAVVRFRGREQLLADLRGWCERADDLAGQLLVGPGGQGKSRLAQQLCERMRKDGWVTGFIAPYRASSEPASRLTHSRLPVLMVVDYAETRVEQVRQLADATADAGERVRLLLLARSAGEWWQQLLPELRYRLHLSQPVALAALEDTAEGRCEAYRDAVRDLAPTLARLPDRGDTDWQALARTLDPPDLSAGAYASILTIQLQALTDLLIAGASDGGGQAGPQELEEVLLEHEELYWQHTALQRGLVQPGYQPATLKRAVSAATLFGAADEDEAVATVTRVPGLGDKTSDERRGVARWLGDLYPAGEHRYWGSLQPDRIGEHLIGQVTRDKPDLIATVLDGASEPQQTVALTALARAVTHQPHLADSLRDLLTAHLPTLGRLAIPISLAAAHPQPLLDALRAAATAATNPDHLLPVNNVLPEQSLLLAPLSLDLTARLVELYQHLAEAAPDAYRPNLARSLNNLSGRLDNVGRHADALAPIEEAVGNFRVLAEANPDAYRPDLAMAQTTLSVAYAKVERSADALAPIEEAVRIRRELAEANPDAYRPVLANSLNERSNRLAEMGRSADALAPIEEAVRIRRELAEANPDAYRPVLANSLSNLAGVFAAVGRSADALAPIEEAVGIYRALAEANPDAYGPDLASSLNNRSIALAAVGRRDKALEASEQALRVALPLLERAPYVVADSGLPLMRRYLGLCEEMWREPDEELRQRMYAVLVSAGVLTPDEKE